MATQLLHREEIELADGRVIEVRPLTIRQLRKFSKVMADFNKINEDAEDGGDEESLNLLVRACQIALEKVEGAEPLVESADELEDMIDITTLWRILAVAGGVDQSDPNLPTAPAQVGRT